VPEKNPSTKAWKTLYDLMGKIKELRPWEWLEEQDIFAVEDPQTKEIGFVSVMGAIGEHYSITVYRGEEGLRRFWDFRDNYLENDDLVFQKLIEIPQLQASFEDRDYLYDEDRKIIRRLGLTFRGKQTWPVFRKYEPGFVPWFINDAEGQFLISVLEQTIDVSLRVKEEGGLLYPDNGDGYLLRRQTEADWQDFIWHEATNAAKQIDYVDDSGAFEKIKQLPTKEISIEMDLFMSPGAIHERDKKPYYPYLLVLLETDKGMIISQKLIPPLPDLSSMWQRMPSIIAKKLINNSFLPQQIYVSSEDLYRCLKYLNGYVTITVNFVKELRIAPQARKSLMAYMSK